MPTFVLNDDQARNASGPPSFLQELNDQQRQAVTHTDGPLLIIAGAGSGKTRVLTYRIAWLLQQTNAHPGQILALTFTNKAAREMQERIQTLIGDAAKRLWMGTFHSIFARILRYEAEHLGYSRDFSIYDAADSERVIKDLLKENGYNPREVRPALVKHVISSAKNQYISPDEFRDSFAKSTMDEVASIIYKLYVNRCKHNNAMDFDDLLIKPIALFESHPEILEKYRSHFQYILIDEYQDTNHAQYLVSRMLAESHNNLCVVGDDAQSIYSFRGADITNILNFKKDYPATAEIPLEQNYRSTKAILKCADSLIRKNKGRLEKNLWTNNTQGDPITVFENFDERDEANRIVRSIQALSRREERGYNDFAVLYRTNYQSRVLEDTFRRHGVPYQLVGGISFYQRKEIKDVTAYLRLVVNSDDDEAVLRVINEPGRGIGEKTLGTLVRTAAEQQTSLWNILQNPEQLDIYKPAMAGIGEFVKAIKHTVSAMQTGGITDGLRLLLEESGYMAQLVQENTHESLQRRQNVLELVNAVSYFEKSSEQPTLSAFLQEISLITDLDAHDSNEQTVTLMTVHGSKGLEFPVVYITGLEEELFPIGGRSGEEVDIEEERRLFYVAITRAEKRLFFSFAKSRFRFGEQVQTRPSRFLEEVDASVVRTETGATFKKSAPSNRGTWISYDEHTGDSPVQSTSTTSGTDNTTSIEYDDPFEADTSGTIRPGMAVIHATFGPGKVIQTEGEGDRAKVVVFFRQVGQKKLLLRLANLKIIG